jgi:hypothetical protein
MLHTMFHDSVVSHQFGIGRPAGEHINSAALGIVSL